MTTKDITGDKLIASIRKTKTGEGEEASVEKASVETASKKVVKKVAKKAPQRRAKKVTPAPKKKATPSVEESSENPFQHGRRVWPD